MSPIANIILSLDAAVGAGLMLAWMAVYGVLFLHLERAHPVYFAKIGRPSLFSVPQMSQSWLLAWQFMVVWTVKSLPRTFPRDRECQNFTTLASRCRLPFCVATVIWIGATSLTTAILLHT
jgi:hypothetical protein